MFTNYSYEQARVSEINATSAIRSCWRETRLAIAPWRRELRFG